MTYIPAMSRSILYLSVVAAVTLCCLQGVQSDGAMTDLVSVEYEIYGEVQGVFFRDNTRKQARRLKLVGWVKNTRHGTVAGIVQGPRDAINQMKHWLQHVGSPMSRIEGASFDEKSIARLEFGNFDISYGR
ncbi:acylphosphatase-2-like [Branchiostoma lanceolatum]|uniref:Acylphosphatase n=1 Tax=Branchiostoma lanceolatum TaxID=7740 RepID=A0A8J9YMP5_BRALA|nr:ACYP2 [Branchiostoma lanceolatum]